VTWLPYDLHPEYPPEGLPRAELHARYGDSFHDRLQASFARAGLAYAPPPEVVPRTLDALAVAELARDHGLHDAVHERLMDAYWSEGRNVGDRDELRALAAEAGLADVEPAFADAQYRERVEASTRQAQALGVSGIPGFLLDRRLLVLGAQPDEVFAEAFAQLGSRE
jgi:predicted DsbA family dithiol-disulfide isomerase